MLDYHEADRRTCSYELLLPLMILYMRYLVLPTCWIAPRILTLSLDTSHAKKSNDALRARGIIPPKPQERRSPSPESISKTQALQNKLETSNLEDDEDLLDLEDEDIPQSILEKYRAERLEQVKKLDKTRRYGTVLPIGRESYTREINEASEEDIDEDNPELKGKGTGVVCFLWKDG